MKLKIILSLSIFSLLFSTAGFLQWQQQNQRESKVYKLQSNINYLNAVQINYESAEFNPQLNSELTNVEWRIHDPFKPREYVRKVQF
ncbi:hypothetical protein [Niallia oryzisoli]|uniref:hypothetical protein n=1 Tax=Niallia oryzisoli TaxID=1737571 RepID=UPI0037355FF1